MITADLTNIIYKALSESMKDDWRLLKTRDREAWLRKHAEYVADAILDDCKSSTNRRE